MGYHTETMAHVGEVSKAIHIVIDCLRSRANGHDASKFNPPESTGFARLTPKLSRSTYGSEEYRGFLHQLGPVLKHHYVCNRHHPEHFDDGIAGMNLVDLLEMFCDWVAAVKRNDDGDIYRSLEINKARFNIPNELNEIFKNTVRDIFEKEV